MYFVDEYDSGVKLEKFQHLCILMTERSQMQLFKSLLLESCKPLYCDLASNLFLFPPLSFPPPLTNKMSIYYVWSTVLERILSLLF